MIKWNGLTDQVSLYQCKTRKWQELNTLAEIDRNTTYVKEVEHFFRCTENRQDPLIDGETARRVLELALAVKKSNTEGRRVEI